MVIGKCIPILVLIAGISSSADAGLSKEEQEYECLSMIAILPVMADARMQALGKDNRVYQSGGSSLLVQKIQNLADEGVPEALYSLGALYEQGYCLPRDIEKGLSLYKEAASRGNKQAKERLNK